MQLFIVHMYIQVDVHACHMFNLGLSDYGTHVEHNISRNTLCPQSTHITVSMDVDTQHIHTYKGYVANHWYLSENQRLLHIYLTYTDSHQSRVTCAYKVLLYNNLVNDISYTLKH